MLKFRGLRVPTKIYSPQKFLSIRYCKGKTCNFYCDIYDFARLCNFKVNDSSATATMLILFSIETIVKQEYLVLFPGIFRRNN